MTFDPNIQPSVLAAQLRAQAPVADAPAPAPTEDTTPDEDEVLAPDPEGEDADPADDREALLTKRERELEARELALVEKDKNLERGAQKKFQQAAEERRQLREQRKASREVEFLATKMGENPEFARDFITLANQYGVRLPDVSREDVAEEMDRVKEEILEKIEEEKFETRKASYASLLAAEETRLTKEHGLTAGEFDAIYKIAQDPELKLLRAGMTASEISKVLDFATRNYLFPRAAANGQRRLVSRVRDKARSAAALATSPTISQPVRSKGFNEDPNDVLAKIRATMK